MNIGDIVTLKSGGPKMTVTALKANNYLDCVWFNENHNALPFYGTFAEQTLDMFTVNFEDDDNTDEYDLIL